MSSKNLRLAIPIAAALFVVVGIYGVATANFAPASPAAPAEVQQDGLPTGAVMFFDLDECPTDWSPLTDAEGRYLVGLPDGGNLRGLVGTELTNEENRPVGSHTHEVIDSGHSHDTTEAAHGHVATASTDTAIDSIRQDDHYHNTPASDDNGYGDYIDSTDLDDDHADRPLRTSGTLDASQNPKIPEIHWQEGPEGLGHTHHVEVSTNTCDVAVLGSQTGIDLADAGAKDGTNAPYIQFLVCRKDD